MNATAEEHPDPFYSALREDDAQRLYDQAPCGYLSTSPDGVIVKVNHTFRAMTGFAQDDLVARRRLADLLTAGGRIYHDTHYLPTILLSGQAREIAFDLVRADGEIVPILVNSVLDRDEDGTPVAVRTAVFDATERRSYERELVRARQRAEEAEQRSSALARTLQSTLIPPTPPAIDGLDVAGRYRPAGNGQEVGGDFFDVFEVASGDWVVAVGDVCGKGVEAAVVTSLARYTIRRAAVPTRLASDVLRELNSVLLDQRSTRHCTVALVRLRRRSGGWQATISCGGHPAPLLVRGADVREVGQHGTLLGVFPDPALSDDVLDLVRGDALVLYTDGISEGRSGDEFFGFPAVIESLIGHGSSARALADGLIADSLAYQRESPRDDLAVVALTVP